MAQWGESMKSNSRASVSIVLIVLLGVVIVVGGILIGELTPLVFPEQASAQAVEVDGLFKILLILGGAIFLLVQILLAYSVIRFRVPHDDQSGDGPPIHGNALLELFWTAVPAVIVVVLAVLTYQVWITTRAEQENENFINGEAVAIEVSGQQFKWSFSYTTPIETEDGQPVVINSNELHTFVGQNLKLDINAVDVIHSFWVPAMRVKQDALPDRPTFIRFTPTRAGEFPVVCAELCGSGHGTMISSVRVYESEEQFLANFYDPAIELVLNPPEDPALRGEQLLSGATYACASCHTLDSLDWVGQVGPNLNGIADRAGSRVPGFTAEEYLVESLYEPGNFLVAGFGALMPQFGTDTNPMPVEDMKAIVAYLCTQFEARDESSCDLDNLNLIATEYE